MITEEEIETSVNIVYIFGDNLQKTGLGGQAKVARPFVKKGKAFGIPTKRKPTDENDAYFSDQPDEIIAVQEAIRSIQKLIGDGKKIVFFPSIGKGYAQLSKRSPKINKIIEEFIYNEDISRLKRIPKRNYYEMNNELQKIFRDT